MKYHLSTLLAGVMIFGIIIWMNIAKRPVEADGHLWIKSTDFTQGWPLPAYQSFDDFTLQRLFLVKTSEPGFIALGVAVDLLVGIVIFIVALLLWTRLIFGLRNNKRSVSKMNSESP